MVLRDPPGRTRLRRAVSRGFHAGWMLVRQPMIATLIEPLLAGLPVDGEFDFLARFAAPRAGLEGQPALPRSILARWRRIELVPRAPRRDRSPVMRGVESLQVAVGR